MPELVAKLDRRSASAFTWEATTFASHSDLLANSASETAAFLSLTRALLLIVDFDDYRFSLADSSANCSQAVIGPAIAVLFAAAAKFIDQSCHQASSGCPCGMANRDCAAIDVCLGADRFRFLAVLAGHDKCGHQWHGGKRLIDLNHIDVVDCHARFFQSQSRGFS